VWYRSLSSHGIEKERRKRGGRKSVAREQPQEKADENKKTDGFKTPKKETRGGETYIRISI
jgi:hypothetical protein